MAIYDRIRWHHVVSVLATIYVATFIYCVFLLVRARVSFYKKVKQGLPMPKWNPIFGHLLVLGDIYKSVPSNLNTSELFTLLPDRFQESDSLFYIDLWPYTHPLAVISSPSHTTQLGQASELGRPGMVISHMYPIVGGNSLFTKNGEEAKRGRALFSAGFTSSYLLDQTSTIVDAAVIYVEILQRYAKKARMITLDEVMTRYLMDVSGVMTLNTQLNCQQEDNVLATALRHTYDYHFMNKGSPLIRSTPLLRVIAWYNGYKMRRYISAIIDRRYASFQNNDPSFEPSKSVLDLALKDYIGARKDNISTPLDPKFKNWLLIQLRHLFFASHDSTSTLICYAHYLLSKHPLVLQTLRDEHEKVFGPNMSQLAATLKAQPQLLNQLPYTQAVVKETLRLHPPLSALRQGTRDFFLEDDDGNKYPTDDTQVWVLHMHLHRNPKYWKEPDTFLPERWLVGPEDPLYPVKGAWRPFEFGSRNCYGQNLALLTIKITLVMTVRSFDFRDGYEEWDKLHPAKRGEVKTFKGERAYAVGGSGQHPAEGFPCFFEVRK